MIQLSNIRPAPLELALNTGISGHGVFATELVLAKGKRYSVVARSGKGKSTLLHIIYGVRNDFTGRLSINGTDTSTWGAEHWATARRTQLSIVFQDLRLFPHLTAWENLALKARLTGHVQDQEIRQMTERLGMTAHLQQTAGTLSYGQRQRIAIVRALCQPFDMLLLDEPFSHLDEENTQLAKGLILEKIAENEAGAILTSLGENSGPAFGDRLEIG